MPLTSVYHDAYEAAEECVLVNMCRLDRNVSIPDTPQWFYNIIM